MARSNWSLVLAGLLATAGLNLVACSSGGTGAGASSVRDALGQVQDGLIARSYLAWADQKAVRTLTGVASPGDIGNKKKVNPRWGRLANVAVPGAAEVEPQLTEATGINPYTATRALTIGVSPDTAGRLDGADTATVEKKFKALGAQTDVSGGRTRLVLAPDDQVVTGNPKLAGDVYLTLNRVVIKGSTVAFGLANGPVDAILGGSRALGDAEDESAMATCLGDVVAAEIMAPPAGSAPGVTLVGVGVRRPKTSAEGVREVLCEVANKDRIAQVAAAIAPRLQQNAQIPNTGRQIQDRLTQTNVDQLPKGRAVRLTVDLVPTARAGFLFFDQGPGRAGLAFLGGGSPPPPNSRP
jgi:hypothetical protein